MTRTGGRAPESIQHLLQYVDFPTDRDHLLQAAHRHGAEPETIEDIKRMPDLRFDGPQDVIRVHEEHEAALHRERSRQPPRQR